MFRISFLLLLLCSLSDPYNPPIRQTDGPRVNLIRYSPSSWLIFADESMDWTLNNNIRTISLFRVNSSGGGRTAEEILILLSVQFYLLSRGQRSNDQRWWIKSTSSIPSSPSPVIRTINIQLTSQRTGIILLNTLISGTFRIRETKILHPQNRLSSGWRAQ